MANRTPKLDKGGISYPESRSLIGYIVLFVAFLVSVGFIAYMAVDVANKLIEGK